MYDWDGKQAECYRLYVDEKKSLDEVVEYWKEQGFEPSKRAFQTQFRRWNFPSKHNAVVKNPNLVDRIKQLWEQNMTQKEMLRTLHDEHRNISERELVRIRVKNRWLLRVRDPQGAAIDDTQHLEPAEDSALLQHLEHDITKHDSTTNAAESSQQANNVPDPDIERARAELLRKRQQESDEKWRTRKRRRRTRGWAGLPADPAGQPPRFPSETTLDEAKAYLNMDNETYDAMRSQFMDMCNAEGVLKKSLAGAEKWHALKSRIIRENSHLQGIFWGSPANRTGDQRDLCLDVICMDVTKRIRVLRSTVSLSDAKNILSLNPTQSREVRRDFQALMSKANFTSKLDANGSLWADLKQELTQTSEPMKKAFGSGTDDPRYEMKLRALEMVCRDVVKRCRDKKAKDDPFRRNDVLVTGGPGPSKPRAPKKNTTETTRVASTVTSQPRSTTQAQSQNSYSRALQHDLQIDPSLLLAASNPSMTTHAPRQFSHNYDTGYAAPVPDQSSVDATEIPAYFRIHPLSPIQRAPKLWLDVLRLGTVDEICRLAVQKHPSTRVVTLEGIVKSQNSGCGPEAREIRYSIDDEEELGGYLAHVAGGKVTFVVKLST